MTLGVRPVLVVTAACILLAPHTISAQNVTAGSIGGTVRDTTGGVLPGVTVEASSPALIEQSRIAVTDSQGNYLIIDLRPGTYSVTFTLSGFGVVRREGIELTTGFTATVNAELQVGSIEETVTVSGAAPVVDVQNVLEQNVITREVLDSVPTARGPQAMAALTVAARGTSLGGAGTDVGGTSDRNAQSMSIHGSHNTDLKYNLDGMGYNTSHATGGISYYYTLNHVGVQEITLQSDGFTAETETAGVQVNAVPKDGGNNFSVYFNGEYTNEHLNSDNVTDELVARGLQEQAGPREVYDYGIGVGGPIAQDRLWFYAPFRWSGQSRYQPGQYLNASPDPLFFVPGAPTYTDQAIFDAGLRLTWQVSERHKLTVSENYQSWWNRSNPVTGEMAPPDVVATSSPTGESRFGPQHLAQVTWTFPATNRLLFNAGLSIGYFSRDQLVHPSVHPDAIPIRELSTGLSYGASALYGNNQDAHNINQRASVSYVTGSHALKAGAQFTQGIENWTQRTLNDTDILYIFLNQRPVAVNIFANPVLLRLRSRSVGLYVQDQWSMDRLTLNLGLRYDQTSGFTLAEDTPAGRFVPARHFAAVDDAPNFKDLSPRLGAAYDLFGDGQTALKFSLGRFVTATQSGTNLPRTVHPGGHSQFVQNANRVWIDFNGNFVPDCDLVAVPANGECFGLSTTEFGTTQPPITYGDDYLTGWGNRVYSWRYSAVLQHELRPGMGLKVGYYAAQYGNFHMEENTAVGQEDFDPYCVTAPLNSQLPGGGGYDVCGFWDVTPEKFGQRDEVVRLAKEFDISQRFDGFDVELRARLPRGIVQGGVSTGRFKHEACGALDRPDVNLFVLDPYGFNPQQVDNRPDTCAVTAPWGFQTQFKVFGTYTLPWDVLVSANFQNLPGVETGAGYNATSAAIEPSLGRPLSAGSRATVGIPLIEPLTQFEDRLNQLDVRIGKIFTVGGWRLRGTFDIYNALNANTVLNANGTYGPAWLQPTSILVGRLFKFGTEITF